MAEERRLVTVLFADVVGSTALGETLDPEDVRRPAGTPLRDRQRRRDRARRHAREVHRGRDHGGLRPAPPTTTMRGRALDAALDLRDRVRADPRARRAAADPPRRERRRGHRHARPRAHDFLVTGDPVNMAARLQQAAEPWPILVGERTACAARRRTTSVPATGLEVKGKAAPHRGASSCLADVDRPAAAGNAARRPRGGPRAARARRPRAPSTSAGRTW